MIYEKLGPNDKLNKSTPYSGSFRFRPNEIMTTLERIGRAAVGTAVVPSQESEFMNYLKLQNIELQQQNRQLSEQNLALQNEVIDLEREWDELESKPQSGVNGIVETIGSAGEKFPWIKDLFSELAVSAKMMLKQPVQRSAVVSGVSPGQRINDAMVKLHQWYVAKNGPDGEILMADDLSLLADLTNDEDMINLALKKLRTLG